MLCSFSSDEYRDSILCEKNDRIEGRYNDEGDGYCFVPLVCNGTIDLK